MLTYEQLKQLREEITLNSLYVRDYKNSFGIDPSKVCDFFYGWLDYEVDKFLEKHPNSTPKERDDYFYKVLKDNDIHSMYDYYISLGEDCLAVGKETKNA